MPRKPRLFLPGIPQHVVQRGVNRQRVFFTTDDCELFLTLLEEYVLCHSVNVHAWCLMTNHIHLLVSTDEEWAVSRVMQDLGRRYVPHINRTQKRVGGLWQGRYKSSHVTTPDYLLCCMRYIDMNPVRASMVKYPQDYRWSSYSCNALGRPSRIVVEHQHYLELGSDPSARRAAYSALFETADDSEKWQQLRMATQQGKVFTTEAEARLIESEVGKPVLPRRRGRPSV